jgi:UDP-glucose 4-epimerase
MSQYKKVSIVAGGAGFIGANLINVLIKEGFHVVIADNFSRGSLSNINKANLDAGCLSVIDCDLSAEMETVALFETARKIGVILEVWHLAANSDIAAGVSDSRVDLKDTFLTTHSLLRTMEKFDVTTFHFASSSAIYGDLGDVELHENIGPLFPISNYGAMKLASEALISAACETFLKKANIFRFPNVVGTPATHGVILDFILKLKHNPHVLEVLGNGEQQKSYLHVSDLIYAMLLVRSTGRAFALEVVNIGPTDAGVTVKWIAEQVVSCVADTQTVTIRYGSANKGWSGDVPKFRYSTERIRSYGWSPVLSSEQSIIKSIIAINSMF